MILGEKSKSRSSELETYSLYFVIAWTFIVGGFLLFGIFQIRHIQQEMVKNCVFGPQRTVVCMSLLRIKHPQIHI